MIKLNSLARWAPLGKGEVFTLAGTEARRIRLEVNSPGTAKLYLVNDHGELRFLAAPHGCDVVEFAAPGNIRITTGDEDVFVYCSETEATSVVIPDAEVFTQIAQRAARNPDMEHLLYLQQINMEKRFAQLAAEMDERAQHAYTNGRASVAEAAPPVADGVRESEPHAVGGRPPAAVAAPVPAAAGATGSDHPVVSPAGDGGSGIHPVGAA